MVGMRRTQNFKSESDRTGLQGIGPVRVRKSGPVRKSDQISDRTYQKSPKIPSKWGQIKKSFKNYEEPYLDECIYQVW